MNVQHCTDIQYWMDVQAGWIYRGGRGWCERDDGSSPSILQK